LHEDNPVKYLLIGINTWPMDRGRTELDLDVQLKEQGGHRWLRSGLQVNTIQGAFWFFTCCRQPSHRILAVECKHKRKVLTFLK
jgi:hypothetical protein